MVTVRCHRCQRELSAERVGVRAVCDGCGAPLHVCRNCASFAPGRANDCSEPGAERVADKEAGNFCDFFRPSAAPRPAVAAADAARERLDALFRKRPPDGSR